MEKVFAFLDSNRGVLQAIQQVVLRDFARMQNLEISFVGAEIVGSEAEHRLLEWNIKNRIHNNLMFFSLKQFQKEEQYDLSQVKAAIHHGIGVYFAAERIVVKDMKKLEEIELHLNIIAIIKEATLAIK